MGKITLYGDELSPPVRACLLTLKALNLPFEYKNVNLMKGEHRSEAFVKKNPQHTVPTLEDDGHILWDSHVIITYLVSKYGKDDSLYPKELLKRAVVDQRLHFESGVLYTGCLRNIVVPMYFRNETQIPQHQIDAIADAYGFLETFLQDEPYIAGKNLTVADFSIISTAVSVAYFLPIDASKYPKLSAWIKRMEALPYYAEANGKGAQSYVDFLKTKGFKVVA